MLTPAQPRPRECAVCSLWFTPQRMGAKVCSPRCASRLVRAQNDAAKADFKARKAALKTIPQLIKEAQIAFNAYIRARDHDKPCICCGRPLGSSDVGGAFDCGHYRSVGSAPHLRFDERNAHGQTKNCNRYGAGRAVDYRIGLIARLGRDAVEALESENQIHKWTREELIEIKKTYAAKARALRKEMQ